MLEDLTTTPKVDECRLYFYIFPHNLHLGPNEHVMHGLPKFFSFQDSYNSDLAKQRVVRDQKMAGELATDGGQ